MTPLNGSARFSTAIEFRRALDERLSGEAIARGCPFDHVRRAFLFQRFLGLVFAQPNSPWLVKGGAGLLMRMAGGRFSQDLDLARSDQVDLEEAVNELRDLVMPRAGEQLQFGIQADVAFGKTRPVVELRVVADIGGPYGGFPVDLSRLPGIVGAPERVVPRPVVDLPGLPDIPAVAVYSLADQVADKVCAMYETHGPHRAASYRYRDLVDLVLVTRSSELDAEALRTAVAVKAGLRGIDLPTALVNPGRQWASGYRAAARQAPVPLHLRTLEAALREVGECLTPILSGERGRGTWRPGRGWMVDKSRAGHSGRT